MVFDVFQGVFQKLFSAPPEEGEDTVIVVAHNNIILYLLMRAAGVPIEKAAQAWNLFHLRHASITRVEIDAKGKIQVISVGASGHQSHANITWNNIRGEDMAAFRGGEPERHKFSGRMLILVRAPAGGVNGMQLEQLTRSVESVAGLIKGFTGYMVSRTASVACTVATQGVGNLVSSIFKQSPQVFAESTKDHPEGVFLEFFQSQESRDTVVLVAEVNLILIYLIITF